MHQIAPHIRQLLRDGAERALHAPSSWMAEIDAATHAATGDGHDPVVMARIRRANRMNVLHWAGAMIRSPGEPVPANLSPEILQSARDEARRGSGEAMLNAYRAGQNAAWLRWMQIAFDLTDDPAELRQLFDASARLIADFVDATVAGLAAQMESERAELLRGSPAARRELVHAILDGQQIDIQTAGRQLAYRLDQPHQAVVIWTETSEPDTGLLDATAARLGGGRGNTPSLAVVADRATLFVWLPRALTPPAIEAICPDNVHVAIGPRASGPDGFRRSHQAARITQRILAGASGDLRVASYEMIRLASVLTRDRATLRNFIDETLGDLATAPLPLRRSLLAFLNLGCNLAAAASALDLHRNTLRRHLARAEDLLPRRLDVSRLEVAVALEAMRWYPAAAHAA